MQRSLFRVAVVSGFLAVALATGATVASAATCTASPATVEVGETVRLDASGSDATFIEFDTDGDGTYEETDETDFIITVSYAETGTYEPVARGDDDDTANCGTITVTDPSEPTQETSASGQDWPTKGYNNRNTGYNPDGLAPTGDVRVDWIFNISIDNTGDGSIKQGGRGFIAGSSPAVVDGQVYFGDSGHGIGPKYLYAVAENGSFLWRHTKSFGGDFQSSPTVAGDRVYIGTADESLHVVRVDNGTKIADNFPVTVAPGGGSGAVNTPTVADGTVYFGATTPKVYAYDARDGTREWVFNLTNGLNTVQSAPAVVDGTVYVTTGGRGTQRLYAVDADTGTEQWNRTLGGAGNAPDRASQVAVSDGRVYVGVPANLETELAGSNVDLYAFDAGTGELSWHRSFSETGTGASTTGPAVAGDALYVGTTGGVLHALNKSTGGEIWNSSVTGRILAQPSVANGLVYTVSATGTFYDGDTSGYVRATDAVTGAVVWNASIRSGTGIAPTPANGALYVAAGERVYRFTGAVADNRGNIIGRDDSQPGANVTETATNGTETPGGLGESVPVVPIAVGGGLLGLGGLSYYLLSGGGAGGGAGGGGSNRLPKPPSIRGSSGRPNYEAGTFLTPPESGPVTVSGLGFQPELVTFAAMTNVRTAGGSDRSDGWTHGRAVLAEDESIPQTAVTLADDANALDSAVGASLDGHVLDLTVHEDAPIEQVTGQVTKMTGDGFELEFDVEGLRGDRDGDQYVVHYQAYTFGRGSAVDVGHFRTPEFPCSQSVPLDVDADHVMLTATNTLGSIGDRRTTALPVGFSHGEVVGRTTPGQFVRNVTLDPSDEGGTSRAGFDDHALHLLYAADGDICGRTSAAVTGLGRTLELEYDSVYNGPAKLGSVGSKLVTYVAVDTADQQPTLGHFQLPEPGTDEELAVSLGFKPRLVEFTTPGVTEMNTEQLSRASLLGFGWSQGSAVSDREEGHGVRQYVLNDAVDPQRSTHEPHTDPTHVGVAASVRTLSDGGRIAGRDDVTITEFTDDGFRVSVTDLGSGQRDNRAQPYVFYKAWPASE